MRLTTKGRYAVTAMLDLVLHSQNTPVTLTEIATRQTISLSYLEQLFSRLRSPPRRVWHADGELVLGRSLDLLGWGAARDAGAARRVATGFKNRGRKKSPDTVSSIGAIGLLLKNTFDVAQLSVHCVACYLRHYRVDLFSVNAMFQHVI